MHIGIDFDNTIVSYDGVFHRVALEQGIVPPTIDPTKLAVRDWLREAGKEDLWTELQGYVYGAKMAYAEAYPGVLDFLSWARSAGIPVSIISHKTQQPFLGPRYDLHAAARTWIETFLRDDAGLFVELENVYFETTKESKWARIASTASTHFIDDLPEILFAEAFPAGVKRILFDPENHYGPFGDTTVVVRCWKDISHYFVQ
jgi:FMN phosphatase YigB (HAD superfamily)